MVRGLRGEWRGRVLKGGGGSTFTFQTGGDPRQQQKKNSLLLKIVGNEKALVSNFLPPNSISRLIAHPGRWRQTCRGFR